MADRIDAFQGALGALQEFLGHEVWVHVFGERAAVEGLGAGLHGTLGRMQTQEAGLTSEILIFGVGSGYFALSPDVFDYATLRDLPAVGDVPARRAVAILTGGQVIRIMADADADAEAGDESGEITGVETVTGPAGGECTHTLSEISPTGPPRTTEWRNSNPECEFVVPRVPRAVTRAMRAPQSTRCVRARGSHGDRHGGRRASSSSSDDGPSGPSEPPLAGGTVRQGRARRLKGRARRLKGRH